MKPPVMLHVDAARRKGRKGRKAQGGSSYLVSGWKP